MRCAQLEAERGANGADEEEEAVTLDGASGGYGLHPMTPREAYRNLCVAHDRRPMPKASPAGLRSAALPSPPRRLPAISRRSSP
jgi:hypothetical protein